MGRACPQSSEMLGWLRHLAGLSHETDMQYCAGAGDIDPAHKGRLLLCRCRSNFLRQDCSRLPAKSYRDWKGDDDLGARIYEWCECSPWKRSVPRFGSDDD